MNQHRHGAAVLFILAWVFALHRWVPMLLVIAFVSWVIAHKWLEGTRGQLFIRRWQRAWPPPTLMLLPVFAVGTLALGVSDLPLVAKVLPVALSTLALAMMLVGNKLPFTVMLAAWALWHDVAVYRANSVRLAGPTYQVASFDTEAACETQQRGAMATEELPRGGPRTERLSDGIKVWDPDRQYFTTLRYSCWPSGSGPAPFR
jgi:hypothetical protein